MKRQTKETRSRRTARRTKLCQTTAFFPPDVLQRDCRLTVHFCRLSHRRRRRCAALRICASRILKYVASALRQADVRLYDSECSFAVLPAQLWRADVSSVRAAQSPTQTWSGGRRRAPGESDLNSGANQGHSLWLLRRKQ